jgi:phosphodiesterase/alkaline phosphatase D-like protein
MSRRNFLTGSAVVAGASLVGLQQAFAQTQFRSLKPETFRKVKKPRRPCQGFLFVHNY